METQLVGERFYGRRVGRKGASLRRLTETALPAFALTLESFSPDAPSLQDLFSAPVEDVWLEIGFGGGEHMLEQMRAHPRVGMIGVEPFLNGVAQVLKAVALEPPNFGERLRLAQEDVRGLLPSFPSESLGKIFVLFSDPWPKKRHHKRRLVKAAFLEECARLLKPGGELILAHDHAAYILEIFELLSGQEALVRKDGIASLAPQDWPAWPSYLPMTRYGQKALEQGRALAFFVWEKPVGRV